MPVSNASSALSSRMLMRLTLAVISSVAVIGAVVMAANAFYPLVALVGIVLIITYLLLWPVDAVTRLIERMSVTAHSWTPYHRVVGWSPKVNARSLAVVLVCFVVSMSVTVGGIQLVPTVTKQLGALTEAVPKYALQTRQTVTQWMTYIGPLRNWMNNSESASVLRAPAPPPVVDSAFDRGIDWLKAQATGAFSGMLEVLTKTIQGVVYALCGLLLIYYLLLDGERLGRNLLELFPKASRPAMAYVFSSTHQVMFSFVKGQVLLGLLTGVYMFIVYTLIGVKYAAFLGSLFALAEILPVIGTYLGIIPGLTVALYTGGPLMALAVFLCSYAYQTVKDNILSPKIVGNVMGLHPVMVILSLLIFGKLGGLVGILFALPLASVFNVVLRACIHGIPRESGRPEAPSTLEANA